MNAVEREPVETRVLNPNACEANYKPKQRSYKKTKLKNNYFFILFFFRGDFGRGDFVGGILSRNRYLYPELGRAALHFSATVAAAPLYYREAVMTFTAIPQPLLLSLHEISKKRFQNMRK